MVKERMSCKELVQKLVNETDAFDRRKRIL